MNTHSVGRHAGSPSPTRRAVAVAGGTAELHRALTSLLGPRGFDIEPVADAAAALSALLMHSPAALLLVDTPPDLDALAVFRRVRFHAAALRTPVAIVGVHLDSDDQTAPSPLDRLPDDAAPADLAAWLVSRIPAEASPEEQLRLTLARTLDEGGQGRAPEDTGLVSWSRLFDHLPDGAVVVDTDGRVLAANVAFASSFGHASSAACVGLELLALLPSAPVANDDEPLGPPVLTVVAASGDERVPFDLTFTPAGGAGGHVFVTVRKQAWREVARAALHANHDLTEQLRRSQKIGALGRLAGGVAHDFNNLLQVIGGYAETLGGDGLDQASRRRLLQRIQRATDRASSLTRQLLAFGRRQVLVPEVLDLNVTVLSLEQMLTRVLGEDVQFVSSLASDVARVRVDPGQIEQVLLNLAINARDAMADGGTLEVSTANFPVDAPWSHPGLPVQVPPGRWVLLSVTDTGTGMDADTASQAFEPFFTTKDASEGSGLGLSMVYGIVKQSGGFTWIDSTPGAGTSVHVLLPAIEEAAAAAREETPRPRRSEPHGGTVLLVEDDPEVRTLFTAFLRDGGYLVHEARDGDEALQVFEHLGADIDLVMTDVVMPHVSGPSLVSALRARQPSLRVLYVSGYTDQLELDGQDPLAAHVAKPVTRGDLLEHIATLLGRPS